MFPSDYSSGQPPPLVLDSQIRGARRERRQKEMQAVMHSVLVVHQKETTTTHLQWHKFVSIYAPTQYDDYVDLLTTLKMFASSPGNHSWVRAHALALEIEAAAVVAWEAQLGRE
jgi:hypothetical protein